MIILGLTGSIGMGKSTASNMLSRLGVPVCDADALTHQFMAPNGAATSQIKKIFPDTIKCGKIDRQILGKLVLKDTSLLRKLEEIIHPMVWEAQEKFLRDCSRNRYSIAALDIPLLFENGADKRCDVIAVVTAPEFLQKQRVMTRSGMTEERYNNIRSNQMSDQLKRKKADFIINTGIGRRHTFNALSTIVFFLNQSKPKIWRPGWLELRG